MEFCHTVLHAWLCPLPHGGVQSRGWECEAKSSNTLAKTWFSWWPTQLLIISLTLKNRHTHHSGHSKNLRSSCVVVVQSLSRPTLCDPMNCSTPGFPVLRYLPESCPWSLWCCTTISSCRLLLLLPSTFPNIKDFSNEWALCIRWPKYWSFSFSISPFSEYSRLISFRIDWLDLSGVLHCRRILYQLSHKGSPLWCQGRLNIITKDTPIPPSFRKLQEFQEHCARNLGQRSNIYFLLYDKCLLWEFKKYNSSGWSQFHRRKCYWVNITFVPRKWV